MVVASFKEGGSPSSRFHAQSPGRTKLQTADLKANYYNMPPSLMMLNITQKAEEVKTARDRYLAFLINELEQLSFQLGALSSRWWRAPLQAQEQERGRILRRIFKLEACRAEIEHEIFQLLE